MINLEITRENEVVVIYAVEGTPDTGMRSCGCLYEWKGEGEVKIGDVVNGDGPFGEECITVQDVRMMKASEAAELMKAYDTNYILTVDYATRREHFKNIKNRTNILWRGDYVPAEGQPVYVDGEEIGTTAYIVDIQKVSKLTDEELDNFKLCAYPEEDEFITVVKVLYGEDEIDAYAVWKEEGAIEDGKWNHANDPVPGTLCALRLGYKDYVEAFIMSVETISADELEDYVEENKIDGIEIGGLYKAYDHERMILHKYGFDPDEEGKPAA